METSSAVITQFTEPISWVSAIFVFMGIMIHVMIEWEEVYRTDGAKGIKTWIVNEWLMTFISSMAAYSLFFVAAHDPSILEVLSMTAIGPANAFLLGYFCESIVRRYRKKSKQKEKEDSENG